MENVPEQNPARPLPGPPVGRASPSGPLAPPPEPLQKPEGVKYIIAVISGKGGVGKSTISANLAAALASRGSTVGLLDADLAGHSQGILFASQTPRERIMQGEPALCYGVKVASLGFLYPEQKAVIWRGPMISKAIKTLLTETRWGELEYLIVDLPPGTSDAQLTVLRDMPISGAIVITTPHALAQAVAERGLAMLNDLGKRPLGVIENMGTGACPHCGHILDIFGKGSGAALAEKYNVPFLGAIPLETAIAEAAEARMPVVLHASDSPTAALFHKIAERIKNMVL